MICPVCKSTNETDANFCLNCSHRIAVLCSRCSRRMVSNARFCDRCGFSVGNGEQISAQVNIVQESAAFQPTIEENFSEKPVLKQSIVNTRKVEKPVGDGVAEVIPQDSPVRESSPLEQYVPKALLKKLESARATGDMVGERRVVTMMFCDIKGSTHAAENLDPEEWSEIINGAFEHMIKPVYKYEGTVARLMGDGILAFFGAPLAHEDDPQRAVLAGLDILMGITPYREQISRDWGIDIDVRVGINTGLVVVGAVGSDLRMEYTALGDAINMAARMEQTAEPGTIQISQDTYKLVKPLFNFEELGGITVKGKDEPVNAYRVLGRKETTGRVRGIEGLHAEMVGRDREMEVLQGSMDDLKQGVGRIVLLLGEAGLGKSRLISETRVVFQEVIGDGGNWFETSSLSYETNQAYALVQRLIQRVSDIGYDDPPRLIQKKLEVLIKDIPEEFRYRAKVIFETIFGISIEDDGSQLEGDAFKQELFEVIDIWLRSRFSDEPTVLVFDDMHWSDGASMALINHLLHLSDVIPVVMICAMRVDNYAPAWQIKSKAEVEYRHRYTEISLAPLSEADSNELVNRLLAIAEIHNELRQSILEKSDGNPFFIEEVVRALIDNKIVVSEERVEDGVTKHYWVSGSDGEGFSIPDNLQSLLAARMDQLEEATRATLQLASVIGRNFFLRVLQAVDSTTPELDKQVGTLLRLDMIRESARVPEVEYTFRNPLTQEAVYKTILLKHRKEFHKRVAEAMEALYLDRLEGKFGLLSHHYSLAGDLDKAIEYCRKASQQAVNVYAYKEAEKNLRIALDLLKQGSDSELQVCVLEELADVCRLVRDFEEAIAIYQEALSTIEKIDLEDDIINLRINRKIVEIATEAKWSVDADTYNQVSSVSSKSKLSLQKSLHTMEEQDPHEETVRMLVALSNDAWRVQDPSDWKCAQDYAESAVEMADKLDDKELLSLALGALANTLDGQSMLRDHLKIALRRVEISKNGFKINERERIDAIRGVGVALMYVGEYANALPYLDEAEKLATNVRAPDQIANALGVKAQCLFRMDNWDEVLDVETQWRDLDLRYTREQVGET